MLQSIQTLSVRQIANSNYIQRECDIFTDATMEEHVLTLQPATGFRTAYLYTAVVAVYTPPTDEHEFGDFTFSTRLVKAHDSLIVSNSLVN